MRQITGALFTAMSQNQEASALRTQGKTGPKPNYQVVVPFATSTGTMSDETGFER